MKRITKSKKIELEETTQSSSISTGPMNHHTVEKNNIQKQHDIEIEKLIYGKYKKN